VFNQIIGNENKNQVDAAAFLCSTKSSMANMKATSEEKSSEEIPQLPASSSRDPNTPTLKFGETLKLDHLGPIVLNVDGSTRRIDNWDEMTEQEKEVTWRRIKERNRIRREALLEKERFKNEESG